MDLLNSSHKYPLTTGIELMSRRYSKQHLRTLYAPIILLGSLDNLSRLRIPDLPGNGHLQDLVTKTRELLIDGNSNSFKYK